MIGKYVKECSPPAALKAQSAQRQLFFSFSLRGRKAKILKPLRALMILFIISNEACLMLFLAALLLSGFPLPSSQRQREKNDSSAFSAPLR